MNAFYLFARAVYRRLKRYPALAPLLDRLRAWLVRDGNRVYVAATLEQGRQLTATRELVQHNMELLDAHAHTVSGLKQANEALAARMAALEELAGALTASVGGLGHANEMQAARTSALEAQAADLSAGAGIQRQASEALGARTNVLEQAQLAVRTAALEGQAGDLAAGLANLRLLHDNLGRGLSDHLIALSRRQDSLTTQTQQRVEFVREEFLFELRKATGRRPGPAMGGAEPVIARIVNPDKASRTPRRINLGCGHIPIPDMINIDVRELPGVDVVADVADLPFEPGSVDELYAAHVLEHFPGRYIEDVLLPYWKRMIKPGGALRLVVPDAEAMFEDYRGGSMSFEDLRLVTFGGQDYDGDFHYTMFTPATLKALLERCGYGPVEMVAAARKNGLCREMEVRGGVA